MQTMFMKRAYRCAAGVAAALLAGAAQAELFDRGGGMIYDNDRNITWLADWNYAKTSGFDEDGLMTWNEAKSWANNLVYGSYADWRLPSALNPGGGSCVDDYNCTGSEFGHMFYKELGATAGHSILTGDPAKLALFKNVQEYVYWFGTGWDWDVGYSFVSYSGWQTFDPASVPLYAVAVRDGDVAAVPEPHGYVLLMLGLTGLAVARRRPH